MARRPDAARLDAARKDGVRSRLIASGIRTDHVDHWLDAWEVEALELGVTREGPDFWDAGAVWIQRRRAKGAPVPRNEAGQ